jgi:2-polyprenyl-3-methyl-5-hydroxy-6-metoxy-1,4-benzoquinol methylase
MVQKKEYKKLIWTSENVKKFWDYESQHKENYFTFQVGKNVVDFLHKYFENAKSALDYGSGPGFLIPFILKKGLKTSALEFSDISRDEVSKRFNNEPNFVGAVSQEEIRKKGLKYDLIIVVEVIEHLSEKYLEDFFNDMKEFLSDDGVAIFTTPNNEDLSKSMIYCPSCDHIFHRWQHERSWSKNSLTKYVEQKGLKLVDIFTTNFSQPAMKNNNLTFKRRVKNLLIKCSILKKDEEIIYPHLVCVVRKCN